jgi:hypothetical protein
VAKQRRLVVATTDPAELPELSTCYLASNLPAPGTKRAKEESKMSAGDLAEVVGLYYLRSWTEQSYKKVKNALGWAQIPGKEGPSHKARLATGVLHVHVLLVNKRRFSRGEGKKEEEEERASFMLAGGTEEGKEVAGAIPNAMALVEGILRDAPAQGVRRVV